VLISLATANLFPKPIHFSLRIPNKSSGTFAPRSTVHSEHSEIVKPDSSSRDINYGVSMALNPRETDVEEVHRMEKAKFRIITLRATDSRKDTVRRIALKQEDRNAFVGWPEAWSVKTETNILMFPKFAWVQTM
jgi:hypothetical protein